MFGKTKHDKIRNDNTRESVRIVEKMVENRLWWFGYREKRSLDFMVRGIDQIEKGKIIRGKERPKKNLTKLLKKVSTWDKNIIINRSQTCSNIQRLWLTDSVKSFYTVGVF